MAETYLQYGCGLMAPAGWINFDASPTMRLQRLPLLGGIFRSMIKPVFPREVRYGDIRAGLPLADGTADGVYCSHVLEHLALDDCRTALRNTFRVLRPGGVFRLVMPDLRALVDVYVASKSPEASSDLMRGTILGEPHRPTGLKGLLAFWLGNAAHRWLWDYPGIEAELLKAGFAQVRRASFNDSKYPKFAEVEEKRRWDDCLGVECIRPG